MHLALEITLPLLQKKKIPQLISLIIFAHVLKIITKEISVSVYVSRFVSLAVFDIYLYVTKSISLHPLSQVK